MDAAPGHRGRGREVSACDRTLSATVPWAGGTLLAWALAQSTVEGVFRALEGSGLEREARGVTVPAASADGMKDAC